MLASDGDVLDIEGGLPARWFREYMAYDPTEDLRTIGCPVLAITGRKDLQVDPEDVECIGALVAGEFTGSTPGKPHAHFRAQDGSPAMSAYRTLLKHPVDTDLLETVSTWVAAREGMQP